MGPGRKRYWLPLVRLSAFFCAVVVGGNLLLRAVVGDPAKDPRIGRDRDYLTHKKRQIQRHYRKIRRLFQALSPDAEPPSGTHSEPVPSPVPVSWGAQAPACSPVVEEIPAEPKREVLAWSPAPETPRIRLAEADPLPSADPMFPLFTWPEVPPPPPPRVTDRMPEASEFHVPVLTPETIAAWHETRSSSVLLDIGDGILKGPEAVFDGVLGLAGELSPGPRDKVYLAGDDGGGLTDRLFDFTIEPRQGRIFSEFMGHVGRQEVRYFSKFGGSELNTPSVQDGQQDVDFDEVLEDQGKVMWDALRKTYFSKYKFQAERTLKEDAYHFNQWRGVDFMVLPPLMGGYLYYRGIDKKFSIAGSRLTVELEPVSKWARGDDLESGVSLFWVPRKRFPVGVIVSAGLYDGDVEMDFIGIGTSASMARRALRLQREE